MKKVLLVALTAVVFMACSKEEVKDEIVSRIEATAVMTADIDSVSVSFPGTTFSFVSATNTLSIAGAALNGHAISISCFVESEGELAQKTDEEAVYSHAINTNDFDSSAKQGSLTITKWDTDNDLISGTFNFKYLRDQDTVYVTNGVFTDLGK